MGGGHALWYLTRGSGVVALLLLTAGVVLGIGSSLGAGGRRVPRFAVASLHRSLTLLAVAFVAVHVLTTVADSYISISLVDAVVPFASSYRPFWLGLGAVAFDLLLALVATSLLRHVVSLRAWRAVHWLAYACWPIALLHSFGTGSDAKPGWFALLGLGSLIAVAVAVRAVRTPAPARLRAGVAGAAALVPILIVAWYADGPAGPGWAHRSGTPGTATGAVRSSALAATQQSRSPPATLPASFNAPVFGTLVSTPAGSNRILLSLRLRLRGGVGGAVRVDLEGLPAGGGVTLSASGVSFVPAGGGRLYTGSVTSLAGARIGSVVRDSTGRRVALDLVLRIDSQQRVSGRVSARSVAS